MYGKLIGAMVGGSAGMLLAWSPTLAGLLAIAGGLVGHWLIDREPDQPKVMRAEWPPQRSTPRTTVIEPPVDQVMIDTLCPVFIELARVDGQVSRVEVRVIREYFEQERKLSPTSLEAVRVALKHAIQHPAADIEDVLKPVRAEVKPAQRADLVRWLYDLALIDGPLTNSETTVLKRIVDALNVSDEQLQQITKQFLGTGAEHFKTLGLTESANDDEIRSAFRRLASENHPDKAASSGPEAAAAATNRFREVKEAYEALKRIRGF